jgi:hypothetical protein
MSENLSPSQRWGKPLKIREDEAPEMCRRRALAGALYGFLGGSAFTLLAGTIDTLLLRDLPVYTDWKTIFLRWVGLGLVLTVVGAITGWFPETAKGIAIGAASLSLAMLVYTLSQTTYSLVASVTLFLVLVLPVGATCVPIAIALRLLLNRQWNEIEADGKAPVRRVLALSVMALILGMFPAFFTRSFGKAEVSLRLMDTLLKNAAAGQMDTRFGVRLEAAPVLKAHIGMAYRLGQSTSIVSSEGYEINLIFADGFKATCTIVAYGDQKPYLNLCVDDVSEQ